MKLRVALFFFLCVAAQGAVYNWPSTISAGLTLTRDLSYSSGTSESARYTYQGATDNTLPYIGTLVNSDPLGTTTGTNINDVPGQNKTVVLTAGFKYYFHDNSWNGSVVTWGTVHLIDATANTTYSITFPLPTNSTNNTVYYFAFQNGALVGQQAVPAGASGALLTVEGLTSSAEVLLQEVTIGVTQNSDGAWVADPSAQYERNVGSGVPTSSGSTAPAPTPPTEATPGSTPGGSKKPPPTTTPTATPTAPTSTPTPSQPVATPTIPAAIPTPQTNPSPTSADPAQRQDVQNAANQVSTAVDKVQSKLVEATGKVTEATDKVAKAVWEAGKAQVASADKVANSVWEAGKANVEASNKVQSSIDGLGTKLGKLESVAVNTGATASKLDTTNSKLETLINGGGDPEAATAPTAQQADLQGSTLTAKLMAKLPAVPTITAPNTETKYSFQFPVPGMQQAFTFEFDLASWSTQIAIFRGVVLASLSIAFFFLTLRAIKEAFA